MKDQWFEDCKSKYEYDQPVHTLTRCQCGSPPAEVKVVFAFNQKIFNFKVLLINIRLDICDTVIGDNVFVWVDLVRYLQFKQAYGITPTPYG